MSTTITGDEICIIITFLLENPSERHMMAIFKRKGLPRFAAFVKLVDEGQDEYEIIPIPSKLDNFNNRPAIFDRMNAHDTHELLRPQTDSFEIT